MVRFEPDKLVIELPASSRRDSIDSWMELHGALCDLLLFVNRDTLCEDSYPNLPRLLDALMPEWPDACKMIEKS